MIRAQYKIHDQKYIFEFPGICLEINSKEASQPSVGAIIDTITGLGRHVQQEIEIVEEAVPSGGCDSSLPIWDQGPLKLTADQIEHCNQLAGLPCWIELDHKDRLFFLLRSIVAEYRMWCETQAAAYKRIETIVHGIE